MKERGPLAVGTAMLFLAAAPSGSDGSIVAGCWGDCPPDEARTEEGCLRNPEAIRRKAPVYPKAARRKGAEGSVTISARVKTDGTVDEVQAIRSGASDETFRAAFEEAAIAAVRKWRYRPGTVNAEPAATYFTTIIEFRLE